MKALEVLVKFGVDPKSLSFGEVELDFSVVFFAYN